jgi:dihydrofolate reductase
MISLVAAMSSNRVIGREQGLPWHIPEDLRFFKNVTKGKVVIMGRKTYDSLGKPLPNRFNIVVSRSMSAEGENFAVCKSLDEAVQLAKKLASSWDDEICVVGGAEIYRQSLDRIYLTEIHREFEGDAFFPEFDKDEFRLTEKRDSSQDDLTYSFCVYDRSN